MMKEILFVMLGGGLGTVLRYLVSSCLKTKFNLAHWATFWINVSGCLALGILFKFALGHGHLFHTFVIVGMIGSYTTFSAFEYENIDLIAHEKYFEFLKYSTFSCAFAFLAVAFGFYCANLI